MCPECGKLHIPNDETLAAMAEADAIIAAKEARSTGLEGLVPEPLYVSAADFDMLLNLLENPPAPNEALKRALARHRDNFKAD